MLTFEKLISKIQDIFPKDKYLVLRMNENANDIINKRK